MLACSYLGGTMSTIERRYNEVKREWENVFVIKGVKYIQVLYHTLYCYWAKNMVPYTGVFIV